MFIYKSVGINSKNNDNKLIANIKDRDQDSALPPWARSLSFLLLPHDAQCFTAALPRQAASVSRRSNRAFP
jgi:hypothetical protein